ncbi:hypothetical protein GCM10022293_05400 [Azospirillum formosense]
MALAAGGQQRLEDAGVGAAGKQLVAVDEVEQRHRLAPQRVDDGEGGIVRAIEVTPANVHDGKMLGSVLPQEPGDVYADLAYVGDANRQHILAAGGRPFPPARGTWGGEAALRRLETWNRQVGRIRGRVEKIFGTWKRSYGLRRARYRGLARFGLQVRLTAIAYNLRRAATILKPVPA